MQIHFLDTEEHQFSRNERSDIQNVIEQAHGEAKQLLPMLSEQLSILVQPSDNVIPETGETGVALHKDLLSLQINPEFKDGIDQVVNVHLRPRVFHEIHHCARYKKFENEATLSENVIMEGLATAFEREFAEHAPLWGDYSGMPIREWTRELLAHKDETDFDYLKWFFNAEDGRRWLGYRVGTYIVDQALENHPKETPATLVHAPSKDIMSMAGF